MNLHKPAKFGRWRIANEDMPHDRRPECLEQRFPEQMGSGVSRIFRLDEDMSYIETSCSPSRDAAVLSRIDQDEPRLVVTLGLRGRSQFVGSRGDTVLFDAGYTTITAFSSSLGERRYTAGAQVEQLRFSLGKEWLEKYLGSETSVKVFGKSGIQLLGFRPISPQALHAAQQLAACSVPEELRRVFRHGQALRILAEELQPLYDSRGGKAARFYGRDKEIAYAARAILQQEFKNPPSVAALARRVGTNQCKLKHLFHHFFETTPYGLLLDIRMHTAYRLLESTHCPVKVAAESVGYHHASNFSLAFAKYFGISPKQV
jgi:AraC family transcriptional activator of pyochelin receptor